MNRTTKYRCYTSNRKQIVFINNSESRLGTSWPWLYCMAVEFTTTYAISAFHHWCCEFESRSGHTQSKKLSTPWYIKTRIGYSTIETKEAARIGYYAPRPSPEYSCGKRNPLYPIQANSFVSIVMYLTCTIIVLLKK
jgi:hypothetical protein